MSQTVTALKNSLEEPGWVEVHLDGIAVFSIRLLEAAHLKVGQALNSQDIERFSAKDAYRRSYGCAVRYLGARPRSTKEVETHLKRKHFPAMAIRRTITRLCEQKYLDDDAFATGWIGHRARLKPRSCVVLRQELRQKGIPSDIIDRAIETVDEVQMACKSIEKRLKSWTSLDRLEMESKVLRYLNYKGYSHEVARQAYRQVCTAPGTGPEQQ